MNIYKERDDNFVINYLVKKCFYLFWFKYRGRKIYLIEFVWIIYSIIVLWSINYMKVEEIGKFMK